MEAGKRIITDIFNRMRLLAIPYFQRSYVWGEANWERLLEDLQSVSSTQRPYFLGSVILKQQQTGAGAATGDVRTVIDGQQRLTTLLLFFKVLCKQRNAENLFRETFLNHEGRLMLQHNRNDLPIFEAILRGDMTPQLAEKFGQNKVLAAFRYFEGRVNELGRLDPLAILRNVYFVGIDLGHDEDEQQVFNTINSLGVSLSTAELLKNDLFNRDNAALYDSTWCKAFEASEEVRQYWAAPVTAGREQRENIDLFMQSYLLMAVDSPEQLRVDELYSSYKTYLADVKDRTKFIKHLAAIASTYKDHIDPSVQNKQVAKDDVIDRLAVVVFGLSTTTVVPYLLYLLSKSNGEELKQVASLLESYLIRRIVCKETSKNYNRFFGALIRDKVHTAAALRTRLAAADTINHVPDDVAFRSAFQSSDLTNKQALVVVWLLELSVRNDKKQSTALSGLSHYSLEHLMPKKWRNHWGSLPTEQAVARDQALKKLGNLSLLASGLNTSISDAAWATKKEGQGTHKGLLEYAKGLETLSSDLALPKWDEQSIAKRATRLAKQAIATWPFPS
jgi:Protein of unknown function DUF262/Protein of unknown function (DUF1524)